MELLMVDTKLKFRVLMFMYHKIVLVSLLVVIQLQFLINLISTTQLSSEM